MLHLFNSWRATAPAQPRREDNKALALPAKPPSRRHSLCRLALAVGGMMALSGGLQAFELDAILGTPFISNLEAAADQPVAVFAVNDHGRRNVYAVEGPDYAYRKLTRFDRDEGQEISSLSISADGRWAVFVRGGDHGANSSPVPVNPTSAILAPDIAIYSVDLSSGAVRQLAEGDNPVPHPGGQSVTFLRDGEVWTVAIDGSGEPERLFYDRGSDAYLSWSPDGSKLAFTSLREDHSFIGIYEPGAEKLRWITPAFARDNRPVWSPDGASLAFVRRPTTRGEVDKLEGESYRPWSIVVADADGQRSKTVWESPRVRTGGVPITQGYYNLAWPLSDRITFVSFEDGWNHLYSVAPSSGEVHQITQGDFTIRYLDVSSDGHHIAFSANTGEEPALDIDRQHIGIASVREGSYRMISQGAGIESYPKFMNRDRELIMLSAEAKAPMVPALYSMEEGGAIQRLFDEKLFGGFDYRQLVTPQQVVFSAPDGLNVHGQLFVPKGVKGKAPALVYIHGGPRRQMYLGWHFMDYYFYDYAVNQYLASQGFIVLSVNYRTGIGYGYDFQNPEGGGAKGASEYQDIVAAGEWLAQRPDVDPARIGVFGGSNGGYLTAMALARDSALFKAGVDIHGIHNRAKTRSGEAAKIAWEASPSRWVSTWKSPVLLIHGDDDQNAGFWHSLDLYNRLRLKGDVEVETLVIPDETHHWMLYANLFRVKQATVEFLDRHLGERTSGTL